jgi:dye decolorizing peroxidase
MSLLTDDIRQLTSANGVLADPAPELASNPARLTVAIGFGPSLFQKLKLEDQKPEGFDALPGFSIDQLNDAFSDGDVLLQVAADDPGVLENATRALIRDSLYFAETRWVQSGFARTIEGGGATTQRNLMGQVDGTDNPALGSSDFAKQVWMSAGPRWCRGGTQMVLRRIRMKLDTWDSLGREAKEAAIGRRLSNGAPLSGDSVGDIPDFQKVDERGLPVISEIAHIRQASAQNLDERFFRRPFNYVGEVRGGGQREAGMLWVAYAANLTKQYLPVQTRLAKVDLLNLWTTPVGSAVFAMARGFAPGETLAEELFS